MHLSQVTRAHLPLCWFCNGTTSTKGRGIEPGTAHRELWECFSHKRCPFTSPGGEILGKGKMAKSCTFASSKARFKSYPTLGSHMTHNKLEALGGSVYSCAKWAQIPPFLVRCTWRCQEHCPDHRTCLKKSVLFLSNACNYISRHINTQLLMLRKRVGTSKTGHGPMWQLWAEAVSVSWGRPSPFPRDSLQWSQLIKATD